MSAWWILVAFVAGWISCKAFRHAVLWAWRKACRKSARDRVKAIGDPSLTEQHLVLRDEVDRLEKLEAPSECALARWLGFWMVYIRGYEMATKEVYPAAAVELARARALSERAILDHAEEHAKDRLERN